MTRFLMLCAMLVGASSIACAQTTIYHFSSKNYTDLLNLLAPGSPPDGDPNRNFFSFSPYTQAMQLQGSITVAKPFPGGLEREPIGPETDYRITWSFDNGLTSYQSAEQFLQQAFVSTNADGDIIAFGLNALSAQPPFYDKQLFDGFILDYRISDASQLLEGIVFQDMECDNPRDNQCNLGLTTDSSAAALPVGGVWTRAAPAAIPTAVPVPGLGGLALMALGTLICGLVARKPHTARKHLAML